MTEPIDDDTVVELANTLAGLRRELAALGVEVSTVVDVDPEQELGPWQAVVDAVRAGVAALDERDAGSILERTVPVVDTLQDVLPVAAAAALGVGRADAVDAAMIAAISDAAALADRVSAGDPDLLLAVESAFAATLAASYTTWVTREVIDAATAATGAGLVDTVLRPRGALARVYLTDSGAVVLDVASVQPVGVWNDLAEAAAARPDDEAVASVRLRALAAVAGLGGAEAAVVATMAPAGVEAGVAIDAGLVIGDAALAAVALEAGAVDETTCALARGAWERATAGG